MRRRVGGSKKLGGELGLLWKLVSFGYGGLVSLVGQFGQRREIAV
jgi:hypothetical protein